MYSEFLNRILRYTDIVLKSSVNHDIAVDYSFSTMLNNSVLRFKKEVRSEALGEDIIELLSRNFVVPDEFSYQLVKVSQSMVARPDLLSYNLYSDDSYGDLLCKLNGVQNPFELNEGQIMICPAPSDLWKFFTEDPFSDAEDPTVPKPKKKSEKRRPMEATQDDVRYTVDSGKRIVVY